MTLFVCPPDDVPWFWLSTVFVPHHVSYQVAGDVIFLSSLDLSVFFGVHVLRGHHVCHVTGELAPGYFNGGRHIFSSFVLESVFLCYDSAGSSNDKSLGGAWAILRDDAKSCRPNVVLGEVFRT